ncbi:hypothetical protein DSO57_1019287 [Entomophthora muscae]|uniref:Uncharacterized protein n=1 Tax=Entomophthora muscae TaxID=34485 RepID=A0ACC2S676_9FUNG|nr:hypothetical protein DSO57_1019287 [Entomophthora muscae]
MPLPSEAPVTQVQEEGLGIQEPVPKRALWLLGSMILMGLDSYFPQLSAVSSLWTPLQVMIPKILSSQSQNDNQIGKTPMTSEAKPSRTNDQSGKDRPPANQATVPEDPKNDDEAANQPEEFEMPNLATHIAQEECPEAPACE